METVGWVVVAVVAGVVIVSIGGVMMLLDSVVRKITSITS